MKNIIYYTIVIWYSIIPLNLAFSSDFSKISYQEIYDIYHKQKYKISIQDDFGKGKVVVSLLEGKKVLDSITITNVTGITKNETMSDIFLSLTFSRRAGMGIGIELTKLFSTRAGKLFESLFLFTTHREESYTYNENYRVFFVLRGMSYKDFSLSIKESKYVDDKIEKPSRHEEWEKAFTIPFDHEEMIFTNGQAMLNGEFDFDMGITKKRRQLINKRTKKLILKDQEYLHIDNKWYVEGEDKTLFIM